MVIRSTPTDKQTDNHQIDIKHHNMI